MCLILDKNLWRDFLNNKPDMVPIRKWLNNKNGKLAYSNHQCFERELRECKESLVAYSRAGRAKLVSKEKVEKAINKINKESIKSNDSHILALAKAGDVKLLVSKDKKLHQDFKEMIKGKVYQNKEHKGLLTEDLCP